MRVGQNPAKFVDSVAQPQKITVALVTYIPFLGGYYAQSLEVLKVCLESIWQNTDLPYDLLVFDNASCVDVRAYLSEAHNQGKIQYLVLSEQNVGKGGAWNFIFGGAPGEYIAYTDSDVYFYPGWLSAHIKVFESMPNLGMLTGAPLRIPEEYATATLRWAEASPNVALVKGQSLPWEDFWTHAKSLGLGIDEGRILYDQGEDLQLLVGGQNYYVGAAHYQFVARCDVLKRVLPIPSQKPMGQVRTLDIAINDLGYLRLCTSEWWARHLGNTVVDTPGTPAAEKQPVKGARNRKATQFSLARKAVQRIYQWAFDWLYRN